MAGKLGGGSGHKRGGMQPNSEPNVIPFIDIMLVMLIIFMVAAPLPTVDIKIDLPPPGPVVRPDTKDRPTTVQLVDYSGTRLVYIENVLVPTKDQLGPELIKAVAEHNPSIQSNDLARLFIDGKIYIDADQNAAYSSVVGLINDIDGIGFKKVSLLVKDAAS